MLSEQRLKGRHPLVWFSRAMTPTAPQGTPIIPDLILNCNKKPT